MWWDSTQQRYEDWHPATFSILWTQLRRVYNSPESMLLFQILAFTTGLAMIVAVASRAWVRAALFFLALFWFLLYLLFSALF